MSDDVTKFINKLDPKNKIIIASIIKSIVALNFDSLDVKKLSNKPFLYRVRKGETRIIFYWKENFVKIIRVGNRDDLTYSGL